MPITLDPFRRSPPAVVVALHSSGASGRQWQGWRSLLPSGTELRTPDLLGYDGGAWTDDGQLSLDDELQALRATLADVPGGVHLLGHSYGGAVALQFALREPQRVRSLTLYEPVRFALLREDDAGLWREIVAVGRDIGALVRQALLEQAAERFVDYWTRRGSWQALAPQRQRAVAARMPKVSAEFEALFADAMPPAAYRSLRVPLRLLCGSRSPRPALRVAARLAQRVPGATLVRLEGLGHLGPIDDAARVAAQLLPQLVPPLPAAA